MTKKHPKGLFLLFMVEMWERFGFYGMRALLMLYMVNQLMFGTEKAGKVYGMYLGLVYMMPLLGGFLADRYLGQRRSILLGGILLSAGYFLLAVPKMTFFYPALMVLIIGNGFFKPNISVVVGQLYEKNDPRRDGGFTIFYMGINIGAFFAPFVCGYLGQKISWSYGFGAAGIGMLIGLVMYIWGQKKYLGDKGLYPCNINKPEQMHPADCKPLTKDDKQKMAAAFILIACAMFFFGAFEQAGSSMTLFADKETNLSIMGWTMPSSWFQALNPFFIVLLAPLFSRMWIMLAAKNKNPSAPFKFIWGLGLLGFGFIIMALAAHVYKTSGPVCMLWLVAVYFMHTLGELCLSPVGLSMITKLAHPRYVSMMMGMWFFSTGMGSGLAGFFAGEYDAMNHAVFFLIPAATSIGGAILLLFLSGFVKRWMHGIE